MCYNPLRIKNPKFRSDISEFDVTRDKLYINVPCGRCGECIQAKYDEYCLRCHYEYLNCVKQGGYCLWNTFTYREDSVPKFMGIMCFSRKHYRAFTKRLRNLLDKYGYDHKEKLKIMWCSEYGTGFSRPHYHALFYINFDITPDNFVRILQESWPHGKLDDTHSPQELVMNPDYFSEDGTVGPSGAMLYVSKYVHKDQDILDAINNQIRDPRYTFRATKRGQDFQSFKDWFNWLFEKRYHKKFAHDNGDGTFSTEIDFSDLYHLLTADELSMFMPFHYHSNHLGDCICEQFSYDEILSGELPLPDKNEESGFRYVKVPQYIDKKIFYDEITYFHPKTQRVSSSYKLNDLGKEMKCHRFKFNRRYVLDDLQSTLEHWHIGQSRKFVVDTLELLNKRFPGQIFAHESGVKSFISRLLGNRTLQHVTDYVLVYKDLVDVGDIPFISSSPDQFDFYVNKLYSSPIYFPKYKQIDLDGKSIYLSKDNFDVIPLDYSKTDISDVIDKYDEYNHSPDFSGFDQILDIYNILKVRLCDQKQDLYLYKQRLKRDQKRADIIYKHKI